MNERILPIFPASPKAGKSPAGTALLFAWKKGAELGGHRFPFRTVLSEVHQRQVARTEEIPSVDH